MHARKVRNQKKTPGNIYIEENRSNIKRKKNLIK